jgi:hypothetical protein
MKLTTKMIKDIIREEIEEAKKEQPLSLDQVAKRLGVPSKDMKNEGIENITPENIMLVMQALAKMGVELSPAILGGGMAAAAMKIKDLMKDKEVDDDPRFYDDED